MAGMKVDLSQDTISLVSEADVLVYDDGWACYGVFYPNVIIDQNPHSDVDFYFQANGQLVYYSSILYGMLTEFGPRAWIYRD